MAAAETYCHLKYCLAGERVCLPPPCFHSLQGRCLSAWLIVVKGSWRPCSRTHPGHLLHWVEMVFCLRIERWHLMLNERSSVVSWCPGAEGVGRAASHSALLKRTRYVRQSWRGAARMHSTAYRRSSWRSVRWWRWRYWRVQQGLLLCCCYGRRLLLAFVSAAGKCRSGTIIGCWRPVCLAALVSQTQSEQKMYEDRRSCCRLCQSCERSG